MVARTRLREGGGNVKEIHFIAFGALDPVDNGYKSTATQLVRALSSLAKVSLFRLPRVGEGPTVAFDGFDTRCADLGVPVVRVALRRDLPAQRLVGAPLAAALSSLAGRRADWISALRQAGLGAGGTPILCFGMGWDPFAAAALQYFRLATFFPADSITLFERNRRTTIWLGRSKRRAATMVAACVERRVARSAIERVVFVSPRDAACVARISGSRRHVAVVPIGINRAEFQTPSVLPLPPRLMFSGVMDYLPNQDAVRYLVTEIFPRVETPGASLRIVGKGAAKLNHLAREGVEFIDWVPSLSDALRDGTLFICPLRMGAGAKNKVVQAMAAGLPVVGTLSSFSGFPVRPPGTFVCDSPAAFAMTIDRLVADRAELQAASRAARDFVFAHCTWEVSAERLLVVMGLASPKQEKSLP